MSLAVPAQGERSGTLVLAKGELLWSSSATGMGTMGTEWWWLSPTVVPGSQLQGCNCTPWLLHTVPSVTGQENNAEESVPALESESDGPYMRKKQKSPFAFRMHQKVHFPKVEKALPGQHKEFRTSWRWDEDPGGGMPRAEEDECYSVLS